jgi:mannose/fructose/N-acetylgalactosamine-specific phosphotransferase system component IIB
MKTIARCVRGIRLFFGYLLLFIAGYVLPDRAREVPATKKETVPEDRKESVVDSLEEMQQTSARAIPFIDLSSYVQAISEPQDPRSACISILSHIRKLSGVRKGPVRLNLVTTTHYTAEGEQRVTNYSNVAGYEKNRWHELKQLEMDYSVMTVLTEEMVAAMAQDGWMCMNDSVEQLGVYLYHCLKNNEKYITEHCAQNQTSGSIRVSLSFVMDATPDAGKNMAVAPQVLVRVIASIKDRNPTESTHTVYFARQVAQAHVQ